MRFLKQLVGRSIILSFFCIPSFASASDAPTVTASTAGVTLQECFERARKISESVGISAENTRLLQYQYRAELGSVLPHLDWIKDQFYQDHSSNGGANGATGSSLLATQPLSYFQLQQPIFAGGRDWQGIRILKSQREQARLNERLTDLQLLTDVATAFYAAYTLQDQISILEETRKLNGNQVEQLNHWVNIGRSRPSESLSARTQLASIEAQIADTQRLSSESRHLLLFLTGVPADVPLQDDQPSRPAASLDDALSRAGKRPELLSTAESLYQAELAIRLARGAYLPTLGFTGRYYTERVGFLTDVRWDATFLLDIPLYEGGSNSALVRVARSQQIIAQLTLARLKRDVERQVRTAYDDLNQALAEVQAYDKAVQLATQNYGVQQKEYKLGTITNLDLLRLLTDMQNIRGQWLISRANARLNDIRLRVAMGEGL